MQAVIDMTGLRCQFDTPRLLHWGTTLIPPLGGPRQRLNRLGTRFALDFTAPPMRIEAEARRWAARGQMAKQFGARFTFHQPDFDVGGCGNPVAEAVGGGMTLPITGGTPRYAVKEGQFFNLIRGGVYYLYCAATQVILNATGEGEIPLTTMLRTQVSDGDAVNLKAPVIEGDIVGDNFEWTREVIRTAQFQFSIEESA